jgi:malonyl CoA-acyl carrier protein transacylase
MQSLQLNRKGWLALFPGQGTHYVQMGKDFYENFTEARDIFSRANERLQFDLTKYVFHGPEVSFGRIKIEGQSLVSL